MGMPFFRYCIITLHRAKARSIYIAVKAITILFYQTLQENPVIFRS